MPYLARPLYLELFVPFIHYLFLFVYFFVNFCVLTEAVLYSDRALCRWMLALNIPDSAKLPW